MFACRKYFEEVIREMIGRGFSFLAIVSIDEADNGNRKRTNHRDMRISTLFFRLPNKAMIIQLDFHEIHENDDDWRDREYNRFWSISVYAAHDENLLHEMQYRYWKEHQWETESTPSLYSLINTDNNLVGFGGSIFCEVHRAFEFKPADLPSVQGCYMDPARMAKILKSAIKPALPILASQFTSLQVTSFPPSYSFTTFIEPVFWKRFPMRRLRRLVNGKIWGSWFSRASKPPAHFNYA